MDFEGVVSPSIELEINGFKASVFVRNSLFQIFCFFSRGHPLTFTFDMNLGDLIDIL